MPPALKYEKVPVVEESHQHGIERRGSQRSTTQDGVDGYERLNPTTSNSSHAMAIADLTSTNSSQQLVGGDAESQPASIVASTSDLRASSSASIDTDKRPDSSLSNRLGLSTITCQEWFTVAVLCFVNLINYMDRFTIAGKHQKFVHKST